MRYFEHGGCGAKSVRQYRCKLCRRLEGQILAGMEEDRICPWCAQSLAIRICEGLGETPPRNCFDDPDEWVAYKFEKKPHLIPNEVRHAVFERDGKICQHCGSTDKLHLDHKQPHSRGGKSTEDNLWVLCAPCNISKSNKTVDEWLAKKARAA